MAAIACLIHSVPIEEKRITSKHKLLTSILFKVYLSHMPWIPEEGQVACHECSQQSPAALHRPTAEGPWPQVN